MYSVATVNSHIALVALGGNLGPVLETFEWALAELEAEGFDILAVSSAYRTRAWVRDSQTEVVPDYWNAACKLAVCCAPEELLAAVQRIEARAGRVRGERWGSRPLDLDILTFGDRQVQTDGLTIPHPEMPKRPFVLKPLVDIAPEQRVPPANETVRALWQRLPEPEGGISEVRREWLNGSSVATVPSHGAGAPPSSPSFRA